MCDMCLHISVLGRMEQGRQKEHWMELKRIAMVVAGGVWDGVGVRQAVNLSAHQQSRAMASMAHAQRRVKVCSILYGTRRRCLCDFGVDCRCRLWLARRRRLPRLSRRLGARTDRSPLGVACGAAICATREARFCDQPPVLIPVTSGRLTTFPRTLRAGQGAVRRRSRHLAWGGGRWSYIGRCHRSQVSRVTQRSHVTQ